MKASSFSPVLVALCVGLVSCALFGSPTPDGTITGTAYAVKAYGDPHESGEPIAGHTVTLMNSDDGTTVATVMTDANGKFMFIAEPGDYSLWGGDKADPVKIESGKTVDVKIAVLDKK
ncbi:MAG: carboxypeptidase-like regulatory domain-containing protein [Candidatus Binataceae bacterium]